jgi:gamma-glutamylputrescine oxidase
MRPLWVDVEATEYPVLDRDLEVDVAIVGGGLSGTGAAYALRDSRLRVALLEMRSLGSGASGRNGGFVLAGPSMSYSDAVAAIGPTAAHEIWDLTVRNNALLAELVQRYEIDCGFLRRGSMSLAVSDEEMQILVRCQDELRSAGISTAILERGQLPRPFDELYVGGIYYPGNGEMNSGAFSRAVGRAVAQTTMIFEGTPVRELTHDGAWQLRTPHGTVRASAVVLAGNAYMHSLFPDAPIQATRGQVLSTAPLDRVVVPFPMYANYGYQYWRQTADGRFVVGGWRDADIETEVGDEEIYHDRIQQHLLDFTRTVVGEAPIEHRWAGIMGFTPDGFPLVGAVPGQPGLYIAAGYSGHGVSMAFTCGGLAAEAAMGQSVSIPEAFDPRRYLG